MTFKDIICREDELINAGYEIKNEMIEGMDISFRYFSDAVSLSIYGKHCFILDRYKNNTRKNMGILIKAIIELLDIECDEEEHYMSEFKNVPCRIVREPDIDVNDFKIVGFGHFMKDRFVLIDELKAVTE